MADNSTNHWWKTGGPDYSSSVLYHQTTTNSSTPTFQGSDHWLREYLFRLEARVRELETMWEKHYCAVHQLENGDVILETGEKLCVSPPSPSSSASR